MKKSLKVLTSEEKEEISKQREQKLYEKYKTIIQKLKLYKIYSSIVKINKVIKEPSFFPEYERKNIFVRYYENYKWLFRFKRYNPSYNLYGLDVKGLRNFDDYVDIKYIKKDRLKEHHKEDAISKHRPENITIRYSILADNKHIFYSYIESFGEKLVPKTYLVMQGEKICAPLLDDNKKKSIDVLNELPNGKYICKATIGAFGDSISVIEKNNEKFIVNNGKNTIEELIDKTKDEPYLVQEYIKQHHEISKFNPSTVNTLRIISTRWNEDTHILAAMMRMGVSGNIVDNASNGGTFVGINIDEGTLMKYGYYYDRPREEEHPETKQKYENHKIPYWEEAIDLIKKLHPIIFGFATIGWDIAITETGPVIVEINWNYSVKGIQICSGGFRKRWEELKSK